MRLAGWGAGPGAALQRRASGRRQQCPPAAASHTQRLRPAGRSYDALFDRFDPLAAGPSTFKHSEYFATATLLIRPDLGEYVRLLAQLGVARPRIDDADMGFLNAVYKGWWAEQRAAANASVKGAVRVTTRHFIPWWLVAWRRTVYYAPQRWAQYRDRMLGVDCSGPLEEKPWGSAWRKETLYAEVYEAWWRLYNESQAALDGAGGCTAGGAGEAGSCVAGAAGAPGAARCCCGGIVGDLAWFMRA